MVTREDFFTALRRERSERNIEGDDLLQVAFPEDERWQEWQRASGMHGDADGAVIALRIEGFGAWYPSLDAAIESLPEYFAED